MIAQKNKALLAVCPMLLVGVRSVFLRTCLRYFWLIFGFLGSINLWMWLVINISKTLTRDSQQFPAKTSALADAISSYDSFVLELRRALVLVCYVLLVRGVARSMRSVFVFVEFNWCVFSRVLRRVCQRLINASIGRSIGWSGFLSDLSGSAR